MNEHPIGSAEKNYAEAKKFLEEKDLVGFIAKINKAIALSCDHPEMLAKMTFLEAEGLYKFNQYAKAVESIEQALQYSEKSEAFKLLNYLGVIKGYLGEFNEAITLLKGLVSQIDDRIQLAGVYSNIAWLYLLLVKNEPDQNLEEVLHYLDLAAEHFDILPNGRKWRIQNNYSVYYYYKCDYEKAIEVLIESLHYCEETDLPDVYRNLTELYLKLDETGIPAAAKEYLHKAEVLAERFKNPLALGHIFSTKALLELREDQVFTALDTLYLAFEHFKEAEAHVNACDCLVTINELMDEYKTDRLKTLRNNLKEKLQGTSYSKKLK